MQKATIIGAGLAGCEAAWQLAARGIQVELYEMRPAVMTPAHKTGAFAELVCSNSFRGASLHNAVGLLKEELRELGSLIMEAADASALPAGGALAVDRSGFSSFIEDRLSSQTLITIKREEMTVIPAASPQQPLIIASGPLTSQALTAAIADRLGQKQLAFYDAISPIVMDESIDHGRVFRQSRYDKGGGADYLNVPLTREVYYDFIARVQAAEKFSGHEQVENDPEVLRPFEGCMPIEDMIARGAETLLFGPFKPKGLRDPETGREPFAVLQLRQDNQEATLWNMVGMQTRMKRDEQQRVFTMLPGLEKAEFARFGSVHRNTFINSPQCLSAALEVRSQPGLFFAGQITGVEGYVESTAAGLAAGLNAVRRINADQPLVFPPATATGALLEYISEPSRSDFQPMNINFGLLAGYGSQPRSRRGSKRERREAFSQQALETLRAFLERSQAA